MKYPVNGLFSSSGAFLIPYVIMMILIGMPLLFMEYAFGQYFGVGSLTIFKKVCPMLQGKRSLSLGTLSPPPLPVFPVSSLYSLLSPYLVYVYGANDSRTGSRLGVPGELGNGMIIKLEVFLFSK